MHMDEVHYMDLYVLKAIVIWLVEVLTNCIFSVFGGYVVEMALKSVHESTFGLSNILYLASFTGDTIY